MSGDGSGPREVSHWKRLSEEKLVGCAVFDLYSRRYRHPKRGTEGDFYVLQTRDWVNVLALTPDWQVVMVRQFRFGLEGTSWEIPGGIMEAGEDPLVAGMRELREETGYVPRRSRMLGEISPNPAIMDNRCFFAVAEGCALEAEQEWDEHEEMEVKLFPIDEVYAMAHRGEIVHSLVVNALFRFYPEWLAHRARCRS